MPERPALPADIVALIEANARQQAQRDAAATCTGATIRCSRCGKVGEEWEFGYCEPCCREMDF